MPAALSGIADILHHIRVVFATPPADMLQDPHRYAELEVGAHER